MLGNAICIGCVVILCAIVLYLWGSRSKLPTGKYFEYTYAGYKAIVVIGNDVVCYGNGFIVGGRTEKIDGTDLARACAISMKVTNDTMRKHCLLFYDVKVKQCVFNFLGAEEFNAASIKVGHDVPELINAYSRRLPKNFKKLGSGDYLARIRSSNMAPCITKGGLAVHELVHIVAHAIWGQWDEEHSLWSNADYYRDGKTLNRIALDLWLVENTK